MRVGRVALIANPISRAGIATARKAGALLRQRGIAAEVLVASAPGEGRELAGEAARGGFDVVAAVGGDGTLGEVANGLMDAGSAVPLGIIPAGTGNDTARCLRVPLDVEAAVARMVEGEPRAVDVGEVNGRRFVGLGVMGFAAWVGERVNRWKAGAFRAAARLLGQRAYHVVCAYYLTYGPRSLRGALECPEYCYEGIIFNVLVASHPGVAGVFLPCPRADSTDGKLDVCVMRARTPRGRRLGIRNKMSTALRAVHGRHLDLPWVDYFQTKGPLRAWMQRNTVFMGDGDVICRGLEFEIGPLPAALRVML